MASHFQEVLFAIADMQRRVGNSLRMGSVHEVKGDKIRVNWGNSPEGEPVLSPWISTHGHNGGARERRFFKKGQNVMLGAVDGDFAKAFIVSHGPNNNHKAPDHANKSGLDEETLQLGHLRISYGKDQQSSGQQQDQGQAGGGQGQQQGGQAGGEDEGSDYGYDIWLEPPEQQDQQQGQVQGQGQQQGGEPNERNTGRSEAKMKLRINHEGGVTLRIGDDVRVHAHAKGAKMRVGDNIVLLDKQENRVKVKTMQDPWINKPWVIKDWEDPIPNDNK
jgi:hypothetical protein